MRRNLHKFPKNSDTHSINTRNKHKLAIPVTRLTKVKKTFKGQCIRLFNKLPKAIQDLPVDQFKKVVKKVLYEKGFYSISDYLKKKDPWQ